MARYKIYDNKSDVITPVGEKLTAEQWLEFVVEQILSNAIKYSGENHAVTIHINRNEAAGDMYRFAEVLPDALQQHHQLVVDEDDVAGLAGELADTEAGTIWPPSRPLRITRPWQTPASPTRPALRTLWKTWWR